MTKQTTLVIYSEVNCKFNDLDASTRRKMVDALKYPVHNARHIPSVRMGRWDGKVSFCTVGGGTFVNLLPIVLPIIIEAGYDIVIDDRRQTREFEFPTVHERWLTEVLDNPRWGDGHPHKGEEILLRDYQVDIINKFLTNPQSVQEIATGAGKCLHPDTLLELAILTPTKFTYQLLTSSIIQSSQNDHIVVSIGDFIGEIEKYENTKLGDRKNIMSLGVGVPTPVGIRPILDVVKKVTQGVKVTFETGHVVECAYNHIFVSDGKEVFAGDLTGSTCVTTNAGYMVVQAVEMTTVQPFYDVSIPTPHVYYDAMGILHHNTIMTAAISKAVEAYGRTIVIVPNKSLVEQTEEDYKNLGLDVGVFYGDRKEYNKRHTICTWQSMSIFDRKSKEAKAYGATLDRVIDDLLNDTVAVVVDECHSAKADKLKELLTGPMENIPLRWGFTGTLPLQDCDSIGIFASLGDVVNVVKASDLQNKGVLAQCHIDILQLQDKRKFSTYHEEYQYLVENKARIAWLAEHINTISKTGNTLILVDRIETGDLICSMVENATFVSGSMKTKTRKENYKNINQAEGGIMVATYGVAAVGINIPRIFNLVLFEPGKSSIRVIQSIGRGIRKAEDKDFIQIYDITSSCPFSKRHLTARKKFYDDANYPWTIKQINY